MKASEIFEGENSSLRKTFDEVVKERSVEGVRFKVGNVEHEWREGLTLKKHHIDILFTALQAERQKREEVDN